MTSRSGETRISTERLQELIEDRWEIGEDVCHSGWKNDQYHDITRALRELAETRREWQPIETVPRDGRRILAWTPQWQAPCSVEFSGSLWCVHGLELKYQPTHWMPLPAAPKDTP